MRILQIRLQKLTSMLSKFKNKSKTNETENRQKNKNSQSLFKICWFLQKKESEFTHIILVSITVVITYIFCTFFDREQANYFKIGRFCLFMMREQHVNGQ